LAQLVGTTDLSTEKQFSKEAFAKAAKSFKKMEIERGEWVKESDIGKYIKADWRAGSFIRNEFGFNAYIKEGYYRIVAVILWVLLVTLHKQLINYAYDEKIHFTVFSSGDKFAKPACFFSN